MNTINKEQFMALLRHTLTFLGGFLVMRGQLDTAGQEQLIGSVMTLAGVIWSYWIKK
jgi:hypothetical protein